MRGFDLVCLGGDGRQVVKDTLALLLSLMDEWSALAGGGHWGTAEVADAAATRLDLPRVEGVGLCFLCSPDLEVRLGPFRDRWAGLTPAWLDTPTC
jgi:hypothetical protein